MKKITQYIKLLSLTVASAALVTSCSDFLDTHSSSTVSTTTAIMSYSDAKNALAGVYDGLQGNSDNVTYYGARMVYYGDVKGDWMQARTLGKRTSSTYEMNFVADNAPVIWSHPYAVIRRANNLIQAIDGGKVTDAKQSSIDNVKGQALAVRALCHFDLLRMYSKSYLNGADANAQYSGIPIILKPTLTATETTESKSGRNTINEVYAQVIKDLEEASILMDVKPVTGYFNKWGAQALLSRVYLQKGDNAKALAAAEAVIASKAYSLWDDDEYATVWSKGGNSELIFEIVNFDSSDWTDREGLSYLISQNGYDDYMLTKKATDYFKANPNDIRVSATIPTSDFNVVNYGLPSFDGDKVWCAKYPGREGGSDFRVNNIYVLRLSEVYLNAAEAAVKLGNTSKTEEYFNATYERSGNPEIANPTLDQVLEERAVELLGEGQRFFDLMRNNKTVDRTLRYGYPSLSKESTVFTRDYFRAILPIPKSEIDTNPVIAKQQNPGY